MVAFDKTSIATISPTRARVNGVATFVRDDADPLSADYVWELEKRDGRWLLARQTLGPAGDSVSPIGVGRGDEEVREAQRKLVEAGFHPGLIDGLIGPRTRAATRAFQARYGLPQTGELDATTIRALAVWKSLAPLAQMNQ